MINTTANEPGRLDQDQARRLTRDDVMTASEVAELLHMPVWTVYVLARRGELPARQLGRSWRFLRHDVESALRA